MSSSQRQNQPPYELHVHSTDALELVKQGASLFILDMPEGTLFGFDLRLLTVGPLFKGIKMIPPGPHFVYYSATANHNAQSVFTGFFIHPSPGDVMVRRWDTQSEMLVKLQDADEEERYRIAVKKLEFDRHLGAYDIHHYQPWKRLTGHLSASVIERFEPVNGDISVIHEAEFQDSHTQTLAERHLQEHLKQSRSVFEDNKGKTREGKIIGNDFDAITGCDNMKNEDAAGTMDYDVGASAMDVEADNSVPEKNAIDTCVDNGASSSKTSVDGTNGSSKNTSGRCFYTQFSHLVKTKGVTGSELSMLNVDKTNELESLLRHRYGGSEDILLGELEFSFIAFLMGQSLESFSQWKSLVCLMLSCDEAPLSKRTRLYVKFLDILCVQLQTAMKSGSSDLETPLMDANWFSDNNFLRSCFKEFYRALTETHPVDGDLLKLTRKLKAILESSLGWAFDTEEGDDENDEYAPVVVTEAELVSYS